MRELHTGHTRANDHDVFGQLGRRVSLTGGEHSHAIGFGPVGNTRPAAGTHHELVETHRLDETLDGRRSEFVRTVEHARAADDPHGLTRQQLGDGALEMVFDFNDSLAQAIKVDRRGCWRQTHIGGPIEKGPCAASSDHRLRRNAVP